MPPRTYQSPQVSAYFEINSNLITANEHVANSYIDAYKY